MIYKFIKWKLFKFDVYVFLFYILIICMIVIYFVLLGVFDWVKKGDIMMIVFGSYYLVKFILVNFLEIFIVI